jgi:hypothetical protein
MTDPQPLLLWSGGMSLALFGLASLPTAFERACNAPPPAADSLVACALALMSQPAARKNSVLFLGAFDRQARIV